MSGLKPPTYKKTGHPHFKLRCVDRINTAFNPQ